MLLRNANEYAQVSDYYINMFDSINILLWFTSRIYNSVTLLITIHMTRLNYQMPKTKQIYISTSVSRLVN